MKMRLKALARATALAFGGVAAAVPVAVLAQAPAPAQAQPSQLEAITVTGSRIVKRDFDTSSPIITISAEELKASQDITLETFLNTLPQVNPAGTTTSNNPGNGGRANIDLRGLGSNRNLILIDGRRPMVSASDQTVDMNTIPLSMIESIEIISGGAAAVYGADAVSGVVNVRLKRRFEGIELSAGYSDSEPKHDALERTASILWGGNFADRRGNAMIAFDYSDREGLIKKQREFSVLATSTTSFFPSGSYRPAAGNLPAQGAIDALFGSAAYGGFAPGTVPAAGALSFNRDGSLFSIGTFNRPADVRNFRDPIDASVNTRFFPDFYSYNFDEVNILTLPLERKSVMAKFDYKLTSDVEVFARFSNTRYTSASALAPSPVPTVNVVNSAKAGQFDVASDLVVDAINPANGLQRNSGQQLVVPVTNPFIPADLAAVLASRTGDNPNLVQSGAAEPFFLRWRTLDVGLRQENFENQVTQYLGGAKGPIGSTSWTWEAHASEGRTSIATTQTGNINTQRLQDALEADDGGAGACAGGINPFGRGQSLSQECIEYLRVKNTTTTTFDQQILQAFASGDIVPLPAGPLAGVVGIESRKFKYAFDPGSASGPISGFNTQAEAGGNNSFRDFFAELAVPVVRNAPFMQEFDLSFAYRNSKSEAKDEATGAQSPSKTSNTWSMNFNWTVNDALKARGSLQKSVRAPNFGELFDGTASNPQIFDPCSATSVAINGANRVALQTLCSATGVAGDITQFVATPGAQAGLDIVGNRDLNPETGNSITLGAVWQPNFGGALRGLRASVDYYRIKVKDAIVLTDSNEYIADCYNYYGQNPTFIDTNGSCAKLLRLGGDILILLNENDPDGFFKFSNGGKIETSGIDTQVNWGMPLLGGRLDTTLAMNFLLSYKQQSEPGLPEFDFKGTIPYFGAGLGQAFPKLKASLSGRYKWQQFGFDARMRYIDKMDNRMAVIFPGETSFTGVPATTYWDFAASWDFLKNSTVRVGVNNAFDQQPRTYAPNVQSGTDPSTYDVIGRRLYLQATMRFN